MKSIFASKTFWWNLLSGAGTILGLLSGVLPMGAAPILAGINTAVNIGLRFLTNTPVSLTGAPAP